MLVSDFNYELPEELIAQQPAPDRSGSRMLTLDRKTGEWRDTRFSSFPDMLAAGDVLVLNNSRVIPARLYAHRGNRDPRQPGKPGKVEIFLTEQISEWEWKVLAKPGKKVQVGELLQFFQNDSSLDAGTLEAEVIARGDFGERTLRFTVTQQPFLEILEAFGHVPLPPYIRHVDSAADRERYQTVYAEQHGSVAVPTAGLHFTSGILDELRDRGVLVCYVTLHVGLGTFQPLRVDRVEDVKLHAERYTLPQQTAEIINHAREQGRRVVAAGTTTVRTLEHCSQRAAGNPLLAHSGATSIFISPGYQFQLVDALLTNFHLPQSSLLMLISAFAGTDHVLAAYRHAVADRYRFFSYGDCMFIF